ncbi:MAG: hypothetical protein GY748_21960, partial [Planctomycetaceae bacterium]|nr:hypothetical protein [Planctomycetaceae bacterium]
LEIAGEDGPRVGAKTYFFNVTIPEVPPSIISRILNYAMWLLIFALVIFSGFLLLLMRKYGCGPSEAWSKWQAGRRRVSACFPSAAFLTMSSPDTFDEEEPIGGKDAVVIGGEADDSIFPEFPVAITIQAEEGGYTSASLKDEITIKRSFSKKGEAFQGGPLSSGDRLISDGFEVTIDEINSPAGELDGADNLPFEDDNEDDFPFEDDEFLRE